MATLINGPNKLKIFFFSSLSLGVGYFLLKHTSLLSSIGHLVSKIPNLFKKVTFKDFQVPANPTSLGTTTTISKTFSKQIFQSGSMAALGASLLRIFQKLVKK